MITDPMSDFITRIRNAQAAGLEHVSAPSSKLKFGVAKILEREGFVDEVKENADGAKRTLDVALRYENKQPVIRSIISVSTPGRRVYRRAHELPRVLSDQGIAIISTSSGLMTNKEARRRRLGGEVLCEVY